MTFQPGTELLSDLRETREAVERCLERLRRGVLPDDAERQRVDIKEEAGRRSGGTLMPATARNPAAADHLSDEVACMANSPGGGALIVGVENRTGDLLGTGLDEEWLRNEIYRRVDVAPDVETRFERGLRLLVLLVPEAREPVEDTGDRIRWRVGASCVPIDRGTWWLHRQGRAGWDPMASPSSLGPSDATRDSLGVARQYLRRRPRDPDDGLAEASDEALLSRIGVLTSEGRLTQAGALLFCASPRPWLSWTRLDVAGGEVLASDDGMAGLSLLEQVSRVEGLIEAANDRVNLAGRFAERAVRILPPRTAREAVLNGVVHRDWHQHEPTSVLWVEADATLRVTSPGGFTGGISVDNVLSQRFARSPALADAVRALGLVDRQGIGVDRMYREMVALGHRPPVLREIAGPRVEIALTGGRPLVPVMALMEGFEPEIRRRDVHVALILHALLHHPFTTLDRVAHLLQFSPEEAALALEKTVQCYIEGSSVIVDHKGSWMLSSEAVDVVRSVSDSEDALRRAGVLWFLQPDPDQSRRIVGRWLEDHDRISSGDYAALTDNSYASARAALDRLVAQDLLVRGAAAGRNAHYLPVEGAWPTTS